MSDIDYSVIRSDVIKSFDCNLNLLVVGKNPQYAQSSPTCTELSHMNTFSLTSGTTTSMPLLSFSSKFKVTILTSQIKP